MARLQKLLKSIRKNFPEIDYCKIKIRFQQLKGDSAICEWDGDIHSIYDIFIDSSHFDDPKDIISALIAHELSHIVQREKLPKIFQGLDNLLYTHLPDFAYANFQERYTDRLAKQRGYPQHILQALD